MRTAGWLALLVLWLFSPVLAASELDEDMAQFKQDLLEVNKRLLLMEEELLFPADTQVAIFLSLDVGRFFTPDSVTLKMDGDTLASHLYTEKEVGALKNGAIQKLHTTNVKNGEHELTAFVTGSGPNERDYRRGVSLTFDKDHGQHFIQLQIQDDEAAQQADFAFKSWR